jgi:hypothetical protein
LLCCGGGITLVFTIVFGAIKSSDVYVEALSRAKGNQDVAVLLGEPIEAGVFPTGTIAMSNQTGNADLVIPLSGPKGSANLHAVATKNADRFFTPSAIVKPSTTTPCQSVCGIGGCRRS